MIRVATTDDASALSRLQAHLSSPAPDLLRVALAAGDVLVSDVEGDPVAYVLTIPDGEGTTVHVGELVVDPPHRREGRAAALLDAVARGAERVTLTVEPDNEAAIACYRACGFERVARLDGYFEDGPALFFVRD
ncbi:MAG: GNAT family N-acetyltransferase [Haloferacaceae archaeon]